MKTLPHINTRFASVATAVISLSMVVALPACQRGWDSTDDETTPTPTPPPTEALAHYNGPGSSWRMELDEQADTFTLNKSAIPGSDPTLEIEGAYEELSNGFLRLTVSAATNGQGINANDTISGIQVGKALTLLLPFGDEKNQILALPNANNCPSQNTAANWLLYKQANSFDSDNHNSNHYGIYTYSVLSSVTELTTQYNLATPTDDVDGVALDSGACAEGLLATDTIQYYFTNGVTAALALAENNEQLTTGNSDQSQFLLTLEQRSIAALSDLAGTYNGIMFDSQLSDTSRNFPVKADCSSGTCTFKQITDIETGDLADAEYSLSFQEEDINSPSIGFVIGNLTDANSNGGVTTCSVNIDYAGSGDKFIACIGISPGSSNTDELFNLFLVSE